jgi:S-adenosylmethionine:diacylglycerol 3-amino-3-carboxypropyl transferase
MNAETMWGRSSRVLFGQMYEDVEIERQAFPPGSRVFTIASAGDSAITLSARHEVTAVDINAAQLTYARERAAGAPARWGVAERFMHLGRRCMAVAGWRQSRLEQFVQMSDCEQQLAFWRKYLDGPLFRALFGASVAGALFALRLIAPRRAVLPPRQMPRWLRARLQRGFARFPNRSNPYAQRLIAGRFTQAAMRASQPICFIHADAAEFLEQSTAGSFQAFSLSNIVDGVTTEYRHRLWAAVRHAAAPDALVVLRSFRESGDNRMSERAAQDRSLLWGSVYAGPVRSIPPCFTS